MPKYTFLINGENIKINLDNNVRRAGFYTTRRVEKKDVETAEMLALDSIRHELRDAILNDPDDPPMLYVDKVYEVDSFEGESVPGKGFTWYDEEDESE